MGWLEAKDGIVPSRVQGWTVIWPGKDGDFVSSKGFGKDCDFEIVPRALRRKDSSKGLGERP